MHAAFVSGTSRLLAAVFLLLLSAWTGAQEQSVRPGINRGYEGADFARWQGMFESEGREVYEHRHAILAALDIRPDMTVADVGAGTGAFILLFASKVGAGGTAIAQDITPEFLEGIAERARRAGLDQVRTVRGDARDARLPANALDLVFTSDVYHHFEYPQDMLASLHRALKPGGRLVIIDYERIPGVSPPWILGHVRAGRGTVIAEVEAAGFRLAKTHALMRENYFLEFVRP